MTRNEALKALLLKNGRGEIPLVKFANNNAHVVRAPVLLDTSPTPLSDQQVVLLALFAGWMKDIPGNAVFRTPRRPRQPGGLMFLMEGREAPPEPPAKAPTLVGYLRTHLVTIGKTRAGWRGTYGTRSETARTLPELLSAMYCFLLLDKGHWVCLQDMRPRQILEVTLRGNGLTPTYTLSERDEPAMVRHIMLAAPDRDSLNKLLREYRLQWPALSP